MYKIAVDLGYGYVKGMNEGGEKIIFPSVVGAAHKKKAIRTAIKLFALSEK